MTLYVGSLNIVLNYYYSVSLGLSKLIELKLANFVLKGRRLDEFLPKEEKAQFTSVESIPEVLEDRDSLTEISDTASIHEVHDMDYVNPRGVRFTQSTQKEGWC